MTRPVSVSAVVYAPAGPASEVIVESFENLSMSTADRRFVQTVVNAESQLVDVAVTDGTVPPNTPTPSPRLAGGSGPCARADHRRLPRPAQ